MVELVDQVATAQVQMQGVKGELAAREVREKELVARAERREREAREQLEAAERHAQRLQAEAEVRATEIVARAERAAREQAGSANADVEQLQRQTARLVDLQAAVTATLGTVVEQVSSTLQVLHDERPSVIAAALVDEAPADASAGAAKAPGAAATPGPARTSVRDLDHDHAPDADSDSDSDLESGLGLDPAQVRDTRLAPTVPRPLTPKRPPEPVAHPRTIATGLPPVDTTIEVHGLAMYAELGALERALAHMDEVQDVYVSAYVDGHAVLQVRQSRSTPLVEQLRAELATSWDVEPAQGSGPVVIRHADPADPLT